MSEKIISKGMVLYTDGGCRPNPGHGGWGIHGYIFEIAKNPKGIGHTTHAATAWGYENKSEAKDRKAINTLGPEAKAAMSQEDIDRFEKEVKLRTASIDFDAYSKKDRDGQKSDIIKAIHRRERVNVVKFVDSFGTMEGITNTNNSAEIKAMTQAIGIAMENKIDVLVIRADSEMVINGIKSWIDGWIKNSWMTKSQKPVANREAWEELKLVKDLFELTGGHIHIEWVKGHGDDIGNLSADWLATIAVYAAQKNKLTQQTDYTDAASDYWGSAGDKCHPMLNHRYVYFIADKDVARNNTYYIGNQGKETDLIAKKTSDAGYAVVQIDEGDSAVDFVINHQSNLKNELTSMCMIDLDSLFGPSYRYTNLYREDFLYRPLSHRYDLRAVDESPITRELRPPVIAMRAIDAMVKFSMVLDDYLNQKGTKPLGTDITSLFYKTTVTPGKGPGKPDKVEIKLDPAIAVGHTHSTVGASVIGLAEKIDVTLTCGIDIPDRNTLKKIESLNPKVSVITWGNDALSFQYAVVIEADDCRGIWAGPFSNLRVLETPRVLKAD